MLHDLRKTAYPFQLTHPTRGATREPTKEERGKANFNSHTPHGVRPYQVFVDFTYVDFNSHTPHGVRLTLLLGNRILIFISTHTPHTGCDLLHF